MSLALQGMAAFTTPVRGAEGVAVASTVVENDVERQALTPAGVPVAGAPAASRDEFSGMSYGDVLRAEFAGRSSLPTFTPTTGAIRWPFSYPVAISAPYGYSKQYSFGWHDGVDFVPGYGAPVAAITAGTVTQVGWDGALGYTVRIQHQVGGQSVVSIYAHMVGGSSDLEPGQQVAVGAPVGLTGQTGQATGPHLQLSLSIGDVYVDPYAWLTANATNQD